MNSNDPTPKAEFPNSKLGAQAFVEDVEFPDRPPPPGVSSH